MLRTMLGMGAIAIFLAAAGCRMCCHPYDYCGPVYDDRSCTACGSHVRAGSVLGGGAPQQTVLPETTTAPRPTPAAKVSRQAQPRSSAALTPTPMRFGDVPGSERLISVTDRVVDSPAVPSESGSAVADATVVPSEPPPSKGWTARRSTPDVLR